MDDARNPNMSLTVVAEKEIQQDNHVTLNYGNLSNDLFLLDYGFIISSNPHHYVELKNDGPHLDAGSIAAGVLSPSFSSPALWHQENFHGAYMVMEPFARFVKLPYFRTLFQSYTGSSVYWESLTKAGVTLKYYSKI